MTQPTAAVLARAATLLDLRRHAEAEAMLRGALAEDPESAEGLRLLARSLLGQHRAQEALSTARAAAALAPGELPGLLTLAHAAEDAGRHLEARQAASSAVQGFPHSWAAHYTLARALLLGHRPPVSAALGHARHAVTLVPHSSDAHNLVGICLERLMRPDEARAAYHEALRLDPHNPEAHNNLATLDMSERRFRSATRGLAHALRLDPGHGTVQANLGVLLHTLLARLYLVVVLGGVGLVIAVLAGAPWPVRAAIGTALLTAYAWLVVSVGRHLPRGLRRPGRGSLHGLPRSLLLRLGLIGVVALTLLGMAYAPRGGADAAAGVLVLVLRAGFIAVVFGGLARALAGAFRRGRPD